MGVCAILHCSLLQQKSPDCPPPIARSAIASLLCTGNLVPRISAEEFCHQRGKGILGPGRSHIALINVDRWILGKFSDLLED